MCKKGAKYVTIGTSKRQIISMARLIWAQLYYGQTYYHKT